MKEYVIMTLLLLPFEDTFKVDSKLWLLDVKVPHCEVELPTTYHDGLNKHEITIGKKKMQLVGNICPSKVALLDNQHGENTEINKEKYEQTNVQ